MGEPRAEVRNAADPVQVARAGRKDRDRDELFAGCLRKVMDTAYGRVVLWALLERAGVFKSVWHPSAAIHYNSGRQDFGHELMAAMTDIDEDLYQLMEREARQRQKRAGRETDAAHTAWAGQQGADNG